MSAFTERDLADLRGERRLARGAEVRGRAETIEDPRLIRMHPERIVSFRVTGPGPTTSGGLARHAACRARWGVR